MSLKTISKTLLATIAGILLPLSLAPFDLYILAFISPVLLLVLWLYSSPKQAFYYGLYYGIGCFGLGVYWVYISIHFFGNASIFLAVLITILLILILSLFFAVFGYIFVKLFPKNNMSKILIAFPTLWVIVALIRGTFCTGFPWLYLGYSQLHTPLVNLAPIFGVYGVSFATVFTGSVIINPFINRKKSALLLSLILLIALWTSCYFLRNINWTKPTGQPIQTSLIQGNIPQELKWQPKLAEHTLLKYLNLSKQHLNSNIIVWPEAAIPLLNWQAQPFLNQLDQLAKKRHTTIVTGLPIENQITSKYYNGLISVGENHSLYLKRHLVPFGEYQPAPIAFFTSLFMKFFAIPMSDFSKGPNVQPPFIAGNINIAPFICYEIAYPYEALTFLPKAQLIVTVSDDSWFGKSIASWQQLQISQMRSLEAGRYQLVATNTGVTAIINAKGKIVAKAPTFKTFVLTKNIITLAGTTPWIRFGYYLWILLAILGFTFSLAFQRAKSSL